MEKTTDTEDQQGSGRDLYKTNTSSFYCGSTQTNHCPETVPAGRESKSASAGQTGTQNPLQWTDAGPGSPPSPWGRTGNFQNKADIVTAAKIRAVGLRHKASTKHVYSTKRALRGRGWSLMCLTSQTSGSSCTNPPTYTYTHSATQLGAQLQLRRLTRRLSCRPAARPRRSTAAPRFLTAHCGEKRRVVNCLPPG